MPPACCAAAVSLCTAPLTRRCGPCAAPPPPAAPPQIQTQPQTWATAPPPLRGCSAGRVAQWVSAGLRGNPAQPTVCLLQPSTARLPPCTPLSSGCIAASRLLLSPSKKALEFRPVPVLSTCSPSGTAPAHPELAYPPTKKTWPAGGRRSSTAGSVAAAAAALLAHTAAPCSACLCLFRPRRRLHWPAKCLLSGG